VQGRGDGERRQGTVQLVTIAGVREQTGFQHRLSQLLDEQRHAIGARHDLLDDLCGQRLLARDPRHQIRPLASAQAAHGQRGYVRPAGPGRLELRPKSNQCQHGQPLDVLDREIQ
jgi:hypothetical protein